MRWKSNRLHIMTQPQKSSWVRGLENSVLLQDESLETDWTWEAKLVAGNKILLLDIKENPIGKWFRVMRDSHIRGIKQGEIFGAPQTGKSNIAMMLEGQRIALLNLVDRIEQ